MKLIAISQAPESAAHWQDHPLRGLLQLVRPPASEAWVLIEDDGKLRGRIGASLSATHSGTGYVGFFDLAREDDLEGASILLERACSFLKHAGATRAVGPVHFNTWLPYRFGLPHEDPLRFGWEPAQPPSHPGHWRHNGFGREMLYASEGHSGLAQFVAGLEPASKRARKLGYGFRKLDLARSPEGELAILHRLSMEGFAGNHLFEPLAFDQFRELYVPLVARNPQAAAGISGFVLDPSGKEVGFAFNFVDPTSGAPWVVLKTAAILPGHRGLGLSNALFHELLRGLDFGIHTQWVSALVREGARSESFGMRAPKLWRHEYELLSKTLG